MAMSHHTVVSMAGCTFLGIVVALIYWLPMSRGIHPRNLFPSTTSPNSHLPVSEDITNVGINVSNFSVESDFPTTESTSGKLSAWDLEEEVEEASTENAFVKAAPEEPKIDKPEQLIPSINSYLDSPAGSSPLDDNFSLVDDVGNSNEANSSSEGVLEDGHYNDSTVKNIEIELTTSNPLSPVEPKGSFLKEDEEISTPDDGQFQSLTVTSSTIPTVEDARTELEQKVDELSEREDPPASPTAPSSETTPGSSYFPHSSTARHQPLVPTSQDPLRDQTSQAPSTVPTHFRVCDICDFPSYCHGNIPKKVDVLLKQNSISKRFLPLCDDYLTTCLKGNVLLPRSQAIYCVYLKDRIEKGARKSLQSKPPVGQV